MRNSPTPPFLSALLQVLPVLFAGLVVVGGIWRMFGLPGAGTIDETTLLYFAVAGALLYLRDLKSLKFGNNSIEFDRRFEELEIKVEDAQAAAVGRGGAAPPDPGAGRGGVGRGLDDEDGGVGRGVAADPLKGKFGGQRVSGPRELDAEVTPISPTLFRVRLQVRSTNPGRDPLRGAVQFFLHPTFANNHPVVTVGPSGVAELTLMAEGPFTVGAWADNGATKLELDLRELSTAPAGFKAR